MSDCKHGWITPPECPQCVSDERDQLAEELTRLREAIATAPVPVPKDHQRVCELIGSIYFYGKFKAETANERELKTLLRKLGYFFETEAALIAKLYPAPVAP